MKSTPILPLAAALLTVASTMSSTFAATATNLTGHDKRAIQAEPFKTFKAKADIPATVMDSLAKMNNGTAFDMADPGEDFQAGDVITRPLPAHRLMFAAFSQNYGIVHYEQGGFAHFEVVVVFRLGYHKAVLADKFNVDRSVTDIAAVKRAIAKVE